MTVHEALVCFVKILLQSLPHYAAWVTQQWNMRVWVSGTKLLLYMERSDHVWCPSNQMFLAKYFGSRSDCVTKNS